MRFFSTVVTIGVALSLFCGCNGTENLPRSRHRELIADGPTDNLASGNLAMIMVADEYEKFPNEYQALLGTWNVTKLQNLGKAYTNGNIDDAVFPSKVIITRITPRNADTRCDVYKIIIDPNSTPKRLSATVTGGEIKNWKMLGVYRFDEGNLILQLNPFGMDTYPTTFVPKPDGSDLVHLARLSK